MGSQESKIEYLRFLAENPEQLAAEIRNIRACSSRRDWRFRRGRARLLYRPVVQALGTKEYWQV